ncbi:MAG TPA: tripartite tricarboxylate transporter substrate binding protein [Bosea sp. (in: a-proteobacteria)]
MPTAAYAAYPDKPIRWIVGYPPGGATDTLARLLGQHVSARLGQPVVVDNRPGAGSALGATALAQAPADGYTLMGADNGTLVINPVAYRSLQYDPDRDFKPVGLYAGINIVLAVRQESPVRSAADFLDQGRAAKDPVAFASPGIGSPLHLAMERLGVAAKIKLSHIPYRGMAPALNDVMGGAVPFVVVDYGSAAELIKGGKLRALATFAAQRLAPLPDVPTFVESGIAGFSAGAWQGLIVPKQTPDDVVAKLSEALAYALAQPQVKTRYADLGLDMPASDTANFVRQWKEDQQIWHPLIRSLGIKLDG